MNRTLGKHWSRWLVFGILWAALPCLGQESDTGATDASPTKSESDEAARDAAPPIEKIPLEEIAIESQSALRLIDGLAPDKDRPALLKTVADQLPANADSLVTIKLELQSIVSSGRAGRRIRRIEDDLSIISKRLEGWQKESVSLTRDIQERLASLESIETLWKKTSLSIAGEEGAETLYEPIGAVLLRCSDTVGELTQLRDEILKSQARVSHEFNRISGLNDRLREINASSRKQLLQPDSPALWDIRRVVLEDEREAGLIAKQFRSDLATIGEVVKSKPIGLITQFLIMVATAVFLFKVRERHQEKLQNDPRSRTAIKLLRHPISTGIVISIVLTPVLVPDPPVVFVRLAVIVVLIPVVILLRSTLSEELKRPAYFIIALFVLLRISAHLPDFSLGQRLLEMIAAVAGAVYAVHQLRISKSLPSGKPRTFPFDRILSKVSFVVYSAAALCNFIGLFSLAQTLLIAMVSVLTLALILVAGANTIREFLRISMVVGPLRHLSAVKFHYATIDRNISRTLYFAAYGLWVVVALMAIGLFDAARNAIVQILQANWEIGALNLSPGSILAFIFAIWVSVLLSRSIRFVLNADILPRFDLPRGIPSSISMMLHYSIISLGLLFALAAAGINLSQLSIVIGALGVGIGFGLQSLVNNFVSGLILIFERPIKVGDRIQFGTNFGEVRSIGIRASNVRSFDGAEIIVPNGNLISAEVINWTLSDQQRRMEVKVGVAYGTDPEKVLEILNNVISGFDSVMKDPKPLATFDGFGESSLDFTARFWTPQFAGGLEIKSSITVGISKALEEAGIEIPFPQRDLHLRSIDEAPARTLGANPGDRDRPGTPGQQADSK